MYVKPSNSGSNPELSRLICAIVLFCVVMVKKYQPARWKSCKVNLPMQNRPFYIKFLHCCPSQITYLSFFQLVGLCLFATTHKSQTSHHTDWPVHQYTARIGCKPFSLTRPCNAVEVPLMSNFHCIWVDFIVFDWNTWHFNHYCTVNNHRNALSPVQRQASLQSHSCGLMQFWLLSLPFSSWYPWNGQ